MIYVILFETLIAQYLRSFSNSSIHLLFTMSKQLYGQGVYSYLKYFVIRQFSFSYVLPYSFLEELMSHCSFYGSSDVKVFNSTNKFLIVVLVDNCINDVEHLITPYP